MDIQSLKGMQFSNAESYCKENGIKLRRYNPSGFITADYQHDRLNVETNEKDFISKIVGFG